jgi:hypothetical protein
LKRKKKEQGHLDDSLTDAQLKRLAKMTAPKSLAPVDMGAKKKHQASLNTIGTYGASLKTTDITQSQTAFNNELDEEALLKEMQM